MYLVDASAPKCDALSLSSDPEDIRRPSLPERVASRSPSRCPRLGKSYGCLAILAITHSMVGGEGGECPLKREHRFVCPARFRCRLKIHFSLESARLQIQLLRRGNSSEMENRVILCRVSKKSRLRRKNRASIAGRISMERNEMAITFALNVSLARVRIESAFISN